MTVYKNKMQCVATTKYYLAIKKKSEVVIYGARMNPENTVNERNKKRSHVI